MIKIYSGENCSYCDMAKRVCNERGVQYEVHDVAALSPIEWIEKIGFVPRSVPQIFADNTYLGGFTEFKTYIDVEGA